jgi:hypothetical protein
MTKKAITAATNRQAALPERASGSGVAEKLVTFQSEREFDVFSGRVEERLFLKLYVAARTSGLLAEISDRDWKTLCVLATYMNAEGFCHPSQAELARALGCSRQMANERVNSLARFRFQEQPVLLIVKAERTERGTWTKNRYRVLPLSQLSIFGSHTAPIPTDPTTAVVEVSLVEGEATPASTPGSTMSSKLDTVEAEAGTVSSDTVTVQLDTNKNQRINQSFDLSNIRRIHIPLVEESRTSIGEASASPTDHRGFEPIKATLDQRTPPQHPTPRVYDEVRQVITDYLQDFARELNDQASLTSSVTRAQHLYQRADTDLSTFISAMYAARSRTQERTGTIRSQASGKPVKAKMAFWFACLEEALGLRKQSD